MASEDITGYQYKALADKVVRTVSEFVETLHDRAESKYASEVLYNEESLRGPEIGQQPERFVEEELVGPLLAALGYEYRFQPSGIDGLGREVPDFTALNAGATVIGEVKIPGRNRVARKEGYEYACNADERPLLVFSTDGFVWLLHRAQTSGGVPTRTAHVNLWKLAQKLQSERIHDKATRKSRPGLREQAGSFVRQFNRTDAVTF